MRARCHLSTSVFVNTPELEEKTDVDLSRSYPWLLDKWSRDRDRPVCLTRYGSDKKPHVSCVFRIIWKRNNVGVVNGKLGDYAWKNYNKKIPIYLWTSFRDDRYTSKDEGTFYFFIPSSYKNIIDEMFRLFLNIIKKLIRDKC